MPKIALPVRALKKRLDPWLDTAPQTKVMAQKSSWPGGFGDVMDDVRSVVVHSTEGWPSRGKAQAFVSRFTDSSTGKSYGVGPQLYISNDGTVAQLIDLPRETWHGNFTNGWSIGVETGNLMGVAAPSAPHHWNDSGEWMPLDDSSTEDAPGKKLYATVNEGEVVVSWWTTKKTTVFAGDPMSSATMMLFSDAQYRAWTLLARYLCESLEIPRNFFLDPHARRGELTNDAASFQAVVNADEQRDVFIRDELAPRSKFNCNADSFADLTLLKPIYEGARDVLTWTSTAADGTTRENKKTVNRMWTAFFNKFRGIHGHGLSGSTGKSSDHPDCPGPLFDWNRFARGVWDYFWFPFDFDPTGTVPPRRGYGHTEARLTEHYWDNSPGVYLLATNSGYFGVAEENPPASRADDPVYHGAFRGGQDFQLQEGQPIYAPANGTIVAARFPKGEGGVPAGSDTSKRSPCFVLLRHEVFHRLGANGRIDYDAEPSVVYSLCMHLAAPKGMRYDAVADENPAWLNQILLRKKEAELGLAFKTAHPKASNDAWDAKPPGGRPTLGERWQADKDVLEPMLTSLAAGQLTLFPVGDRAVHVTLGDVLGAAGVLTPGSGAQFGICLAIFSTELVDLGFDSTDVSSAVPFYGTEAQKNVTAFVKTQFGGAPFLRTMTGPVRVPMLWKHALRMKSPWSLTKADFPSGGWEEREGEMWWLPVQLFGFPLSFLPTADLMGIPKLPSDGVVWHYHPLGFLQAINERTWKSEWPKFHITDDAGAAAPVPARPRSRKST